VLRVLTRRDQPPVDLNYLRLHDSFPAASIRACTEHATTFDCVSRSTSRQCPHRDEIDFACIIRYSFISHCCRSYHDTLLKILQKKELIASNRTFYTSSLCDVSIHLHIINPKRLSSILKISIIEKASRHSETIKTRNNNVKPFLSKKDSDGSNGL